MKSEFFYFHNIAPMIGISEKTKTSPQKKRHLDSLQRLWVSSCFHIFLTMMRGYIQQCFVKHPPIFPRPPENQIREVRSGNIGIVKDPLPRVLTLDTHPEQIIFILYRCFPKIGEKTQNGVFFFGNTPIIQKYFLNLNCLEHFLGCGFPLQSPFGVTHNWPLPFYLWGQETPRPPARVPMRYTKRSCWSGGIFWSKKL